MRAGRNVRKFALYSLFLAGAVFLAPIAYEYLKPRQFSGTFGPSDGVSCGCGHALFTHLTSTGYYDFVPAHNDKTLLYTLRPDGPNEWIGVKNGTNASRLRFDGRDVYITFPGRTTNWFKEERVL